MPKHLLLQAAALCALLSPAHAQSPSSPKLSSASDPDASPRPLPAQGQVRLERLASGLSQPLFACSPPGDRRIFVLEKTGCIRIIAEDGKLQPEPFLDLTAEVTATGERGLLGLAFEPDYARHGRFYVCYSEQGTTDTKIARYTVSPDRSRADAASRQVLLTIPQTPERTDHKAGWIGFRPGDPNRNLYIAVGDGGGANNPEKSAQNLQSLKGKILRLDVSGSGSEYAIPADNPFANGQAGRKEIWAYGLRNPYRPSFDRQTGDLYIADVGQDTEEEIDFEPAGQAGGRNYGWPFLEGRHANAMCPAPAPVNACAPLYSYLQAEMPALRAGVIGGYVYRGHALPELAGKYFFADFTNAVIRSFREGGPGIADFTDHTRQLNADGQSFFYSSVSSFGEDRDGELLLVDFSGSIFRLVRDPAVRTAQAAPGNP